MPDKLPDPAWGAGPGADTDFHTRFAEFWDLDTSLTDLPKVAFERRRGTEAAWLADGGGRRRLRFYHSVTTIGWLGRSSAQVRPALESAPGNCFQPPPGCCHRSGGCGQRAQ
ncbi:hypothetical protein ACF1B0_35570 [Streptomyces anandii]|uniref:hypothetical protein n=1 Tax=Streptomyces anandii TaxID=285454 RepID=UPI0036FC99FF